MATFKVGQRVRIVRVKYATELLGREAMILRWREKGTHWPTGETWSGWELSVDGIGELCRGFRICYEPEALAPLTDPKADEFVESIKKLKPYEEPKVAPRVVVS